MIFLHMNRVGRKAIHHRCHIHDYSCFHNIHYSHKKNMPVHMTNLYLCERLPGVLAWHKSELEQFLLTLCHPWQNMKLFVHIVDIHIVSIVWWLCIIVMFLSLSCYNYKGVPNNIYDNNMTYYNNNCGMDSNYNNSFHNSSYNNMSVRYMSYIQAL